MAKHSKDQLFGLNFKGLFEGYPSDYPCLVQYMVDTCPFGFMHSTQLTDIVEDGFMVTVSLDN